MNLLKQSVESFGGCLLSSEEAVKQGLVTPEMLSLEKREALRADMESAIRANNSARNSSLRAAAHIHIV